MCILDVYMKCLYKSCRRTFILLKDSEMGLNILKCHNIFVPLGQNY